MAVCLCVHRHSPVGFGTVRTCIAFSFQITFREARNITKINYRISTRRYLEFKLYKKYQNYRTADGNAVKFFIHFFSRVYDRRLRTNFSNGVFFDSCHLIFYLLFVTRNR